MATITKRTLKTGELVYDIRVKLSDEGSGRKIRKGMTWRPENGISEKKADKEVILIADKYEQELQAAISGSIATPNPTGITFAKLAEEWREMIKNTCSLSYYVKTEEHLAFANQYIGGYKVMSLTPSILQNYFDILDARRKTTIRIKPKPDFEQTINAYNTIPKSKIKEHISIRILNRACKVQNVSLQWAEQLCSLTNIDFYLLFEKQEVKEPYAWETTVQYKRTVRSVLSFAKKKRLIQDNWASAQYVTYPKKVVKPIKVMGDAETQKFFEILSQWKDIRQKTALYIFLFTGFRRGEVCGLEWQDIDFENHTICVERSVIFVKGYGLIEKEPKTEKSKRIITVSSSLIDILQEYREYWLKLREICGDYMQPSNKLFTNEKGGFINPDLVLKWLKNMLKKADVGSYTLHSLRHTCITLQLLNGVPLVTASARAGHSRTSTTSDIYAHFLKSSDMQAADVLDNLFTKNSN